MKGSVDGTKATNIANAENAASEKRVNAANAGNAKKRNDASGNAENARKANVANGMTTSTSGNVVNVKGTTARRVNVASGTTKTSENAATKTTTNDRTGHHRRHALTTKHDRTYRGLSFASFSMKKSGTERYFVRARGYFTTVSMPKASIFSFNFRPNITT